MWFLTEISDDSAPSLVQFKPAPVKCSDSSVSWASFVFVSQLQTRAQKLCCPLDSSSTGDISRGSCRENRRVHCLLAKKWSIEISDAQVDQAGSSHARPGCTRSWSCDCFPQLLITAHFDAIEAYRVSPCDPRKCLSIFLSLSISPCACSLSANLIPGMESWFTILLDAREGQGLEHQKLPMMPGLSVMPVLYHAGKRNRKCHVSIHLRPKQEKTPCQDRQFNSVQILLTQLSSPFAFQLFSLITLNVPLPFFLFA